MKQHQNTPPAPALLAWGELLRVHEERSVCQNCGRSADRLTFIPEFEYMGCDDCVEESHSVLTVEGSTQFRLWEICQVRLALANDCSTVDEFRRALREHAAECAVCSFEGQEVTHTLQCSANYVDVDETDENPFEL